MNTKQCLNCGHNNINGVVKIDDLGSHMICKKCCSSFDTIVEANDSYTIGYSYLKNKYGYKGIVYTSAFREKLHKTYSVKARRELEANATEKDYHTFLKPIDKDNFDDRCIELLLGQYYYGYTIRFELFDKLCSMGIISL